jgi:parallel beta-helix repeat protein
VDGADYCIIRNNIIHDCPGTGYGNGIRLKSAANTKIYNNIIYNNNHDGIVNNTSDSDDNEAYNNTCYNNALYGINRTAGTIKISNNICMDNTSGDFNGTFMAGSDYNYSSDGTGEGTNALLNQSAFEKPCCGH